MSGSLFGTQDNGGRNFLSDPENGNIVKNPLHCPSCSELLSSPILLPCSHVMCRRCLVSNESQTGPLNYRCKTCLTEGNLTEERYQEVDPLVQYLLDSSQEPADRCANCDKVAQPMFFCETCQQPLCYSCKEETHQAKMFSAHSIVPHEERTGLRGTGMCQNHKEPFALFSTDNKQLLCVRCFQASSLHTRSHCLDLESAHKVGCERLEKTIGRLKNYQQEVKDQILLHKKLMEELKESDANQSAQIKQSCQQMVDSLLHIRDSLLKKLKDDRAEREKHFSNQLRKYFSLLPTIQLYLLGGSILCSSAGKLDFLELSFSLTKRITSIMAENQDLRPEHTGALETNFRDEFARALEPFLGLSSILLGPGSDSSGNGQGTPNSPASLISGYRKGKRSGGAGYVNLPYSNPNLFRYQLMVDLAGAFGEEFAKVDVPTREFAKELSSLGREAQELQRDMTLRRVLIDQKRVEGLQHRGKRLEGKLAAHTVLIQEVQPNLQQIWQEQLDRVRRQQQIFRDQVETSVQQRERIRQILQATIQLKPFLESIARAVLAINPRRNRSPSPAPMDQICNQIKDVKPNPESRMQAIEVEESKRRVEMEKRRKDETLTLANAKKQLRSTGGNSKEREARKSLKISNGHLAKIVERSRSRGGTDPATAVASSSTFKRRSWVCASSRPNSRESTARPESSLALESCSLPGTPLDASTVEGSYDDLRSRSSTEDNTSKSPVPPPPPDPKVYPSLQKLPSFQLPSVAMSDGAVGHGDMNGSSREQKEDNAMFHPVLSSRECSKTPPSSLPNQIVNSDQPTSEASSSPASRSQIPMLIRSSAAIPKPPKIPPSLTMTYVDQSTLEAREKVLESLKMTVPRVDVGVSNSPERSLRPDHEE